MGIVQHALEVLRRSDPVAADVVTEVDLAGKSLRELGRLTGVDRRRLAAIRDEALVRLGEIIEDLA